MLDRARKSLKVAEQMLIHTYPVVEDPKLILAVAGDVYAALEQSMDALLAYGHDNAKDLIEKNDFEPYSELFQTVTKPLKQKLKTPITRRPVRAL